MLLDLQSVHNTKFIGLIAVVELLMISCHMFSSVRFQEYGDRLKQIVSLEAKGSNWLLFKVYR